MLQRSTNSIRKLTNEWIGVISAGISVLAVVLNIALTSRQTRVSVESFKFNNDTQVMNWANRVVVAMAEAYHLNAKTDLHALATSLSALIDEGRWFFPNIGKKDTDHEKHGAYQGTRQAVLDSMLPCTMPSSPFRVPATKGGRS